MRLLGRLLCSLGFHRPPPRIEPERSLYWFCARCEVCVPDGALAKRRP